MFISQALKSSGLWQTDPRLKESMDHIKQEFSTSNASADNEILMDSAKFKEWVEKKEVNSYARLVLLLW